MRYRNNSQRSSVISTYWTRSGPSAPLVSAGTASRTVGSTDEMEDAPTKGYARISALGGIVNTPMIRRKSVYTLNPRSWKQWSVGEPSYVAFEAVDDRPTIGEFTVIPNHPYFPEVAARLGELQTQALTAAYARVGRADMEVLVSLAELSETIAFLWSPVEKGIRLVERGKKWLEYYKRTTDINTKRLQKYRSLPLWLQTKRGPPQLVPLRPFRTGKWHATDVSSFWLAMRYGLMPIIADLQDLWQSLLDKGAQPERVTARATASDEIHIAKTTSNVITTYSDRFHTVDASFTIKVRAGVLYVPREVTFQSQYGLELHRLPAAAYEAITLSFVTDWFHSASVYYDAITVGYRSKAVLAAWTTSTIEYSIIQSNTQVAKNGGRIDGGWGGQTCGTEIGSYKVRTPATLSQTAPQLRLALNAKRMVDGLALIHLFLGSRAKGR